MPSDDKNTVARRFCWLISLMLLATQMITRAAAAEPPTTLADILDKEKFPEIFQFAKGLAERTRTTPGWPDTNTASALDLFGQLQFGAGNYPKAAVFLCENLAVCERVFGPEHPVTALSLNNLGLVCQYLGNHVKAEQLLQRSLTVYEKTLGAWHSETATALNNLALAYQIRGNYAQAEPLLERVVKIFESTKGDCPETAMVLSNLSLLVQQMGAYAKAEPLIARSLKIYEKTRGAEHPDSALAMKNMGLLHFHTGNYAQAELVLAKSLEISQRTLGPEHPQIAVLLTSLGEVYRVTGEFERAEPSSRRGLATLAKALGSKHPETLKAMNNLGLLYETMGQYEKAEPLLQASLQGYEQIFTANHPDTLMAMNNLALLYRSMADYAKAEVLLERSLRTHERVLGPDHPDTGRALNNLALLFEQTGDFARAEPLMMRSLRISQKTLGPDHPRTAVILANLAYAYRVMKRYGEAEALLTRSLGICEQALGTNRLGTALALNNLGVLFAQMGEYARAEPFFERSLRIYEGTIGPFHQETATALQHLSLLKLDLRQRDAALALARRCRLASERNLGLILSFASERQRLSQRSNRDLHLLDIMATLESSSDVAELTLRTKGIVLDSLLEDELAARASKEPEVSEVRRKLQVAGRRLTKFHVEGAQLERADLPRQQPLDLDGLEQQIEGLQATLARHVASLGQARRSLRVTVPQVQEVLARDSVLLEFVRYVHYLGNERVEERYGAVVIASEGVALKGARIGEPVWVPLTSAQAIEQNLRDYGAVMRGEKVGDATLLQSLCQQLIEPIQRRLPSAITTFLISADAELNFLSFATLVDAQKRFLAEQYRVRYVACGRDLLFGRAGLAPSRNFAAFANPAFAQKPAVAGRRETNFVQLAIDRSHLRDYAGMSLGALPNTSLEAQFLRDKSAAWRLEGSVHVGEEASESAVKAVKSPHFLHLATHGFFLPDNSTTNRSSIQARLLGEPRVPVMFHNPMLRSGLAFTGAQLTLDAWKRGETPDTENDGILMAQEVGMMDLKDTWLVVLSACDTGIGEARSGEGVMGLRRGFVQAGAQNLLMTLWPISDKWSVDIMKAFYEKAMASRDAPQAMADVQAEWLAKLRKEKGVLIAARIAGPFVLSTRGRQSSK